jgi:hypothetical protein
LIEGSQWRARECNVAVEPKAREKGDDKNDAQGGNVRRDKIKSQVDITFLQYEMKNHKVQHPVEYKVSSSAHGITECLSWHQQRDGFAVEEIYESFYCVGKFHRWV